jgi:multidrug efflux pump
MQRCKRQIRYVDLMTSLAFGLGVFPLVIATGASAETQHAISTGVLGGMISATVLAIFFHTRFLCGCTEYCERIAKRFHKKTDADKTASSAPIES